MSFSFPALLLLLWLVPLPALMILWIRKRTQSNISRLVHPSVYQNKASSKGNIRFNTQITLFTLALALLCISAAGPRWGERDEVIFTSGRNVLILLDVSRSMLANDVHPNRLERAKADLSDLLPEFQGDRAGIMAFREGSVLLCPFTTDMSFLKQTLTGISIDSAPRGETDIHRAISDALDTFSKLETDHNAIILISDGEDLSGKAVQKATEAGERGIPIFCVGIGDTQGSTIPNQGSSVVTYRGEQVVSKLDNQTLYDIATASNGAYIPLQTSATGSHTLGTLYKNHIKSIIALEMQEELESRLIERFQIFLIPGVILMLMTAALSLGQPGRKRRAPRVAATALVLIALQQSAFSNQHSSSTNIQHSAFSNQHSPSTNIQHSAFSIQHSPSESAHALARQAQKAWKRQDAATAAQRYDEALAKNDIDPKLESTLRYNAALAHLEAGNTGRAAELFRLLASDPKTAADSAEGLGVALFRAAEALTALQSQQKPEVDEKGQPKKPENYAAQKLELLEETAHAFQNAMRNLPDDDTRKQNLAATLAQLPKLREEIRLTALTEKYGQMQPDELIKKLLEKQREVFATSSTTFTNNTPNQIYALEALATRQQEAADIWIPLSEKLIQGAQQSITNQNDLAKFTHQINLAKDQAEGAAAALANLDPAAMEAMRTAESSALQFLAMTAPPLALISESIYAQSNALAVAIDPQLPRTPAEEQAVSMGFFDLFSQQYGPWLDQMAQQAQQQGASPMAQTASPTPQAIGPRIENTEAYKAQQAAATAPQPLTPEQRAEIDTLVAQVKTHCSLIMSNQAKDAPLLSNLARKEAEAMLPKMQRIYDLLPKPQNQNQQQQQNQDQQQQQKQDQQDQQDQQDKQNQDQQDQDQQQDQNDQQKQDEEKSEEEQKKDEQEEQSNANEDEQQEQEEQQAQPVEEKSADEKEAEDLMAKILEQEKQREKDKRDRQRDLPVRLGERDW